MAADQECSLPGLVNKEGNQEVEADLEESQEGEESYCESESDEEEVLQQFGIYQCLPVGNGEPDFEAGEPTTAEEYLRRVRWEAARLAPVVTCPAPLPSARREQAGAGEEAKKGEEGQQPQQPQRSRAYTVLDEDVAPCPAALQPSLDWLRAFLAHFSHLRRQLQREHELSSSQGDGLSVWRASHQAEHMEEEEEQEEDCSPSSLMPELYHIRGLEQVEVLQRAGAHLRRVSRGPGLSPQDAAWLYAYSARIEKPLLADTCALYRALLKHCCRLRAEVCDPQDPLLPHLNILIAIAGCYFGQDQELAHVWDEQE
ncbi:hypothetical protein N2152v2_000420 [Parachlorella kessleri]